jgi:hypothetical protein
MSDHRKCDDLHVDDLHVKAKQDRTGTTIILEGEFDMTAQPASGGSLVKRSRRARDRSPWTQQA